MCRESSVDHVKQASISTCRTWSWNVMENHLRCYVQTLVICCAIAMAAGSRRRLVADRQSSPGEAGVGAGAEEV